MRHGGSILLAAWLVISSSPLAGGARENPHHRHVRQTAYWLDIMVLVDQSTLQWWYQRTDSAAGSVARQAEARAEMKRYFTLVVQEVSDLYSRLGGPYRFNFQVVGFYMNTEVTDQWLAHTADGKVDAEETLTRLKSGLKSYVGNSQYDHAILFTRQFLAADNQGHTTGRGFTGTMCKGESHDSLSIVQDRGAFQSVFTIAHELGHSLNARHDGTANSCSMDDRYVMAPEASVTITDDNNRNAWYFSTCSQSEITSFVNGLSQAEVSACLERKLPQDDDVPDVTGIVPGQLYGADVQCQHLYGPQSHYCFFGSLQTICTDMACSDPSKVVQLSCNLHLPATGTSCGNKRWCQVGECEENPDAPAMDSCVKDQTTTVNGLSCSEIAARQPALCYDRDVFTSCCRSCQQVDSGVEGCPYGNRVGGCSSELCQKILSNGDIVDEQCCQTCNFKRNTWSCRDADSIDGVPCATAVKRNGVQGCYNHTVAFHCCATCRDLRDLTRPKGCEYGDLLLQGCSASSSGSSKGQCDSRLCCATCLKDDTGLGNRQRSLPLLCVLILVYVCRELAAHWGSVGL